MKQEARPSDGLESPGFSRGEEVKQHIGDVSPTHVGMDRPRLIAPTSPRREPHARGDRYPMSVSFWAADCCCR